MNQAFSLRRKIRFWILFFMISLIVSGVTAIGVETSLYYLTSTFPTDSNSKLSVFLWKVYWALKDTNVKYPFLSYGYDWLAFAHIVIAIVFWGVLKDPVRNKWVVQFGRIACALIIPFAFVMGTFRGLPIWWILIDCSFGIIGLIPLTICYTLIDKLERITDHPNTNQPI